MPTRALVFDFDGTLADTESAVLQAWQEVFREHGTELLMDAWYAVIGTQHTTPATHNESSRSFTPHDRLCWIPASRSRQSVPLRPLGCRACSFGSVQ